MVTWLGKKQRKTERDKVVKATKSGSTRGVIIEDDDKAEPGDIPRETNNSFCLSSTTNVDDTHGID